MRLIISLFTSLPCVGGNQMLILDWPIVDKGKESDDTRKIIKNSVSFFILSLLSFLLYSLDKYLQDYFVNFLHTFPLWYPVFYIELEYGNDLI